MTFERPEAWPWLLLAVPIVLLHLRWRKRRRVVVSSLGPWMDLVPAGRSRAGLRRVEEAASLGLLLAALAAVVGAWAGPVAGNAPPAPRRLAIVLDASASMNARVAEGRTRFDAARDAAVAALDRLGPEDEVVVWLAAATPLVAVDPTRDHAAARAGLSAARPTLSARTLVATRRAAWAALGDGGSVLVLTDAPGSAALPPDGSPVGVAGLGADARSDGIQSIGRDPEDPGMLRVRIRADLRTDAKRTVRLLRDGTSLAEAPVDLARGETMSVVLPLAAFDEKGGLCAVRLEPPDDFPEDDSARLLFPSPRKLRVAVTAVGLQVSPFLLDALRAMPDRVDVDSAQLAQPDAPAATFADADVVICDGDAPDALAADRPVLVFGARGRAAPAPRVWTRGRHPVLAGIDLSPLRLDTAQVLDARPTETVLVDSDAGPVAVCGERGGARYVRFGFRPEATTLALESAFPLIVRNAIDWLVRGPLLPPSVAAGGPLVTTEPFPAALDLVWIEGPGGAPSRPFAAQDGRLVEPVPLPPPGGPYLLRVHGLGRPHETVVAWTAPPGFALDGTQPVPGALDAAAAVAALPDRRGLIDTRVRVAPWLAGAGALFLGIGALVLRRRGAGAPVQPAGTQVAA